jgi:transcriptional regulator with XRE-family HTH domain
MSPQIQVRAAPPRDDPAMPGPWSILPIADTLLERRSSTSTRLGMPFVLHDLQQIARAVGVDRRSLSAWVKGSATPSIDKFERLQMLAEVARDIDAAEPGRSTEVLLSRAGSQDLLDHIAAGHFHRARDWHLSRDQLLQ